MLFNTVKNFYVDTTAGTKTCREAYSGFEAAHRVAAAKAGERGLGSHPRYASVRLITTTAEASDPGRIIATTISHMLP